MSEGVILLSLAVGTLLTEIIAGTIILVKHSKIVKEMEEIVESEKNL